MPNKVKLDEDEVARVNRVRIARYLSLQPAQVDAMPVEDVLDVLAVMRADIRIEAHENSKQQAQHRRSRRGKSR